ncbi:hypothetical protein LWF15_33015 [Kineosporia rhizophila]|uniref:hypothetical protein n=1 Tax=Kineosporia TaxID=49184 RepID=UPI001E3335B4|nr:MULTISPECIES: hypothetical protein [Kineosporia]MCE0540326.1 hypothetical protein [Kineosporia rhizophila]
MRAKRSVFKAAVAVPVAALLLAGCGGGDDDDDNDDDMAQSQTTEMTTPAPDPSQSDAAAAPGTGTSPAVQDMDDAWDQISDQLEAAGRQAGPDGFAKLACDSVEGTLLGGQMPGVTKDDTVVVSDALGEVLESILDGVEDANTGVTTINVDNTLKKECPDVHADAVKASGVNDLNVLLD